MTIFRIYRIKYTVTIKIPFTCFHFAFGNATSRKLEIMPMIRHCVSIGQHCSRVRPPRVVFWFTMLSNFNKSLSKVPSSHVEMGENTYTNLEAYCGDKIILCM